MTNANLSPTSQWWEREKQRLLNGADLRRAGAGADRIFLLYHYIGIVTVNGINFNTDHYIAFVRQEDNATLPSMPSATMNRSASPDPAEDKSNKSTRLDPRCRTSSMPPTRTIAGDADLHLGMESQTRDYGRATNPSVVVAPDGSMRLHRTGRHQT